MRARNLSPEISPLASPRPSRKQQRKEPDEAEESKESDAAKTRREAGGGDPTVPRSRGPVPAGFGGHSWVTPAWCCWESQHAFWPREESLSDRLHALLHAICPTSSHAERRKTLPVLKAPPKKPKTASLQIRIEEEIRQKLDHYAEFTDAPPSYVVTEALKLLFKRDE